MSCSNRLKWLERARTSCGADTVQMNYRNPRVRSNSMRNDGNNVAVCNIVENLVLPPDRRVWQEAMPCPLRDIRYRLSVRKDPDTPSSQQPRSLYAGMPVNPFGRRERPIYRDCAVSETCSKIQIVVQRLALASMSHHPKNLLNH